MFTRSFGWGAFESLEGRTMLSVTTGPLEAKGGKPAPAGPAIRMDLVVLHELGHSLGLEHTDNVGSIMDPYYNANYDLSNFANDPAVAKLNEIYTIYNGSAPSAYWTDVDEQPADGDATIDVTYSFVPDGTRLERGRSDLFGKFDAKFGRDAWQAVFREQLQRWAGVSGGKLTLNEVADGGQAWGAAGREQGDSRFGDIRIGGHNIDGSSSVLAHAWLPSTGYTVSGDLHLDTAENWVLGPAPAVASATTTSTEPSAGALGLFGTSPIRALPVASGRGQEALFDA